MGHDGACAEYLVTRARYVHKIPDPVTMAEAALTEPLAVVHKALRRLGSSPDSDQPKRCAVFGAGTIGHLASRVLALRGHSVTVFDKDSRRLALLDDSISKSRNLHNIEQFDWLIEATGAQAVLRTILNKSRTGATILLLGLPYAEHNFNFDSVVAFDRTIVGSVGSNGTDFEEALRVIPEIETAPFQKAVYPLDNFEQALKAAHSRSYLKVTLQVPER
jgi:threonine dehydrogenase-like Zn-dependent dehydrogenase